MMGFGTIAKKVFGTPNDRKIKATRPLVEQINALEPTFQALDDAGLKAKTVELRERLKKGDTLDDLLPEAFANAREAARRTLGLRPFDVQLMGGIFLHQGNISEMKTGEGKTLVATMPAYLNALTGRGVHVVTVNDYLAKRDAEWMGLVYHALGMTVGVVVPGMEEAAKKVAYDADITYATNNELGFDYLRDNMKSDLAQVLQRDHYFAIVDEVDSILIDEARTPLIISGPSQDRSELYIKIDKLIPKLTKEHYDLDEKQRADDADRGGQRVRRAPAARDGAARAGRDALRPREHQPRPPRQPGAARARPVPEGQGLYRPERRGHADRRVHRPDDDRAAAVRGAAPGDRGQGGRGDPPENVTLASVTFQNYFRLYEKLAGMTGTAVTEADEFFEIYKLGVVEVPTNMPVIRQDHDDQVFRTAREKYEAIVEEIKRANEAGQPILVGTTSIEKSENLSEMLKKAKVPHNVLNARYHEQEAGIVAEAGVPGAVTIATNMAGRGTDIQLGGNVDMRVVAELEAAEKEGAPRRPGRRSAAASRPRSPRPRRRVLDAGGLYVLATERHESRRIDNQLRGRSGRQGDPGRTNFYLSLEDDLMRIFGSERLELDAEPARDEGGRGDRPSLGEQGAGEGAGQGRGAQLRHPQEPPEVRRRDERPAQGDLRPAPRDHGVDGRRRRRPRHAPAGGRGSGRRARAAAHLRRPVGRRGPRRAR